MVSHVVEVEFRLSAFLSEHNFCKIDVISAKTVEKSYSDFFHTTPAELRQSTFSPRIISSRKYWFPQNYCYGDILGSFFLGHVTVCTPFFIFSCNKQFKKLQGHSVFMSKYPLECFLCVIYVFKGCLTVGLMMYQGFQQML